MTTPRPRWAKRTEAATYLGVSLATFNRYLKAGTITPHTLGPATRYDLNEIDNVLRSGSNARLKSNAAARDQAALNALDTIRARIPTGKPLISVAAVLEIVDAVAADYRQETTP